MALYDSVATIIAVIGILGLQKVEGSRISTIEKQLELLRGQITIDAENFQAQISSLNDRFNDLEECTCSGDTTDTDLMKTFNALKNANQLKFGLYGRTIQQTLDQVSALETNFRETLATENEGGANECDLQIISIKRRMLEEMEAINIEWQAKQVTITTELNGLEETMANQFERINQALVALPKPVLPKKWELIFRATAGSGVRVYDSWLYGGSHVSTVPPSTMQAGSFLGEDFTFRSRKVENWSSLEELSVRFSLYKDGKEVAFVTFNRDDSDLKSWFSLSRVIESSWIDLRQHKTFNYFSVDGHPEVDRRFFINFHYHGCPQDVGHVTVVDGHPQPGYHICHWDRQPTFPQFLYSPINTADRWDKSLYGRADFLAIFIR